MLLPRYYFDNLFNEFESLFEENCIAKLHIESGKNFVHAGDMMLNIFYVKSGIYKCSMLNENGSECIMAYMGPGSLYPVKCEQYNFSIEPTFTLMAITNLEVYQLTPEILTKLIYSHPKICVSALHFHALSPVN